MHEGLHGSDGLDVFRNLGRFLEIIVGLQAQPELFRDPEIPRQPQSRIRGNGALAEDDFIDSAWRDMDGPG